MDNGFTFDGQHSLVDWGVIAIRDKKRPISAPGQTLSYAIGGLQGTLAFGDAVTLQEYTAAVTLYAAHPLDSETAATALWRQLTAWLCVGRRPLIWDSEPDKYVMAEVTNLSGEKSSWVEEGLKVTFRMQPELRGVECASTRLSIRSTERCTGQLRIDSGLDAPICLRLTNAGAATVTGLTVSAGGRSVELSGFSLGKGDALALNMETPVDATLVRGNGTQENALPFAQRFERLTGRGTVALAAQVTAEGNAVDLLLQATARGIWR